MCGDDQQTQQQQQQPQPLPQQQPPNMLGPLTALANNVQSATNRLAGMPSVNTSPGFNQQTLPQSQQNSGQQQQPNMPPLPQGNDGLTSMQVTSQLPLQNNGFPPIQNINPPSQTQNVGLPVQIPNFSPPALSQNMNPSGQPYQGSYVNPSNSLQGQPWKLQPGVGYNNQALLSNSQSQLPHQYPQQIQQQLPPQTSTQSLQKPMMSTPQVQPFPQKPPPPYLPSYNDGSSQIPTYQNPQQFQNPMNYPSSGIIPMQTNGNGYPVQTMSMPSMNSGMYH